jgi:HD-GYP domain-containing protein (c-di-GMP phosphodiesterase class II)
MDGTGYPQGLRGEEILPEARVIAVADTVEAMSSHRPYRPALGLEAALEEISRRRGSGFDPEAVDACLRLFRERGFTFEEGESNLD